MTKKRYINQYDDVCKYCDYKAENRGGSGKVSFVVDPGQLYCSYNDNFMEISRLKEVGIFCNRGRK